MKSWMTRLALAGWCSPPLSAPRGPRGLEEDDDGAAPASRPVWPRSWASAMPPSPPPDRHRNWRREGTGRGFGFVIVHSVARAPAPPSLPTRSAPEKPTTPRNTGRSSASRIILPSSTALRDAHRPRAPEHPCGTWPLRTRPSHPTRMNARGRRLPRRRGVAPGNGVGASPAMFRCFRPCSSLPISSGERYTSSQRTDYVQPVRPPVRRRPRSASPGRAKECCLGRQPVVG